MPLRTRVKLPDEIKVGDIIEIKTLVSHVMETGQRRNPDGTPIARNIVNSLKASFNGEPVFAADLYPGISSNPYLAFHMKVTEPGELEIVWTEDRGPKTVWRASINPS